MATQQPCLAAAFAALACSSGDPAPAPNGGHFENLHTRASQRLRWPSGKPHLRSKYRPQAARELARQRRVRSAKVRCAQHLGRPTRWWKQSWQGGSRRRASLAKADAPCSSSDVTQPAQKCTGCMSSIASKAEYSVRDHLACKSCGIHDVHVFNREKGKNHLPSVNSAAEVPRVCTVVVQ